MELKLIAAFAVGMFVGVITALEAVKRGLKRYYRPKLDDVIEILKERGLVRIEHGKIIVN